MNKKVLDKLIKLENKNTTENDYFLSIYFPTENFGKEELWKNLRPYVLNTLKENKNLKEAKSVHEIILEKLEEEVNQLEALGKGLAFFLSFNKEKLPSQYVKDSEMELLIFYRTPEKESYTGKVFDLDQLVWFLNFALEGVVVSISRKTCDLYVLTDRTLQPIESLENEKAGRKERGEYIQKFSPIRSAFGKIFHGTGAENVSRRKKKESEEFLKKLTNYLRKNRNSLGNFNFLILFHSSEFTEIIEEKVRGYIKRFMKDTHLLIEETNIQDKEKLRKNAIEKVREKQKEIQKDRFKKAKNDYSRYKEGWEGVLEAIPMKKIDTLFVNPLAEKEGYLKERSEISLEKKDGFHKVKNISPWIVKSVMESGGDLVVLRDAPSDFPEIAAHLRF